MTDRVLVTPRSLTDGAGQAHLQPLVAAGYELVLGPAGRQPSEHELLRLLPGCVGYIAGVERITEDVIASGDRLRVISRNGAGTDNIDLDAALARGVYVARAAGANARGVAELTLSLMLDALRHVSSSDRAMRHGGWDRVTGREAAGRNIGIVGFGAVGREVAGLAAAIGMRCVIFDVAEPDEDLLTGAMRRAHRLEDLLSACDIVTLHCPPDPHGAPLLGRPQFGLLPRGCILINTARWSLVDEAALLEALDSGVVDVYATDTFRVEPAGDDPIVRHPRSVVTPHIGGLTLESVARAGQLAVRNLMECLVRSPGPGV